ncbi:MAG: creatininase family protein [Synergistetes bacterium]|nr:creatininase family protein [Synergistota bacterium]
MKGFLFDQLTGHEFKEGNFDKVILPVGSTEYHGDHLPFGTDAIVSYELAKEVAKRIEGLLVLPPVHYGMSDHYANFLLTISVRAEVLIEVLKDILYSLVKHGMYKIFILNGHDGNIAPIEVASRAVKVEYPEVKIAALNAWWVSAGNLLPKGTFEVWGGLGHAGEGETSIMLSLKPELVEMEHAKGVVPTLPEEVEIKWLFDELTPYGATGDPTKATKEKGDKMKEVLVNLIVSFFEKMEQNDWRYGYEKEE